MNLKRVFTSILALTMILTLSCGNSAAFGELAPMSSFTLSDYNVGLKVGVNQGEIRISYDVAASKRADSLGVSSIAIYRANGSHVATITGTTANKLVRNSTSGNTGTYSYIATSGTSYYAEVTVFATVGSTTDSRMVTTTTVKAS